MGAVLDKKSIGAAVAARVGNLFAPSQRVSQQPMATGIPTVDLLTGGLPRGCITEISGEVSSGRTSFVASVLAEASRSQECIAYIDVTDSLDPATMHQAGVDLDRLLWVRCGGKLERALRVADLVLQGGGFGITVLDLAGVTPQWVRRIPMAYWFRFRRGREQALLLHSCGPDPVRRNMRGISPGDAPRRDGLERSPGIPVIDERPV